eukprot:219058-Rhodomonas_salina.2
MPCPVLKWVCCYTVGTGCLVLRYAATPLLVLTSGGQWYWRRVRCYADSGTENGYGATSAAATERVNPATAVRV